MNEEKKLIDEEIVKELMNESNRGEWCELSFIDCVEVRVLKNAIDLIHRLQVEKKELQESADLFNDFNEKLNGVIAEQKAEIERLTKERNEYIVELEEVESANEYANRFLDEYKAKNMELQKQVDELKVYLASEKVCSKQAVKDTAKEICEFILKYWQGHDLVECDWLRVAIAEKYGVDMK